MAVFGRRGRNPDAVARASESLRSIEAGGLPLAARERLAASRVAGTSFTSDLSTAEFLLVRRAGLRPLTQVMGSCFFQVGWQYMPGQRGPAVYWGEGQRLGNFAERAFSGGYEYDGFGRRVYSKAAFGQVFELDVETEAWQKARGLALGRLAEEARLVGADAVLGLHLRRDSYKWSRKLLEFVAIGTAVASDRYDLGEQPLLSTLSGQEFSQLLTAGYLPVGIAAGTAVVYVVSGWQQGLAARRLTRSNAELRDYTQGVQHARELALARVTREATALGASGVVGLSLEVQKREREHEGSRRRRQRDMVVTVNALGTAIAELAGDYAPPATVLALPLDR